MPAQPPAPPPGRGRGGSPPPVEPPMQGDGHREHATGVMAVVQSQIDAKIKVAGIGELRVVELEQQRDPEAPARPDQAKPKPKPKPKTKQQPPPATAQDPEGLPAAAAQHARDSISPVIEADHLAADQKQQADKAQKRLNKFCNKILLFQAMVFGVFYSGFPLSPASSSPAPAPAPPQYSNASTPVAKAADMFFYAGFLANIFSVSLGQSVVELLPLRARQGLAWVTCVCMQISSYLFLVSLNRWYAFTILALPVLLVVAVSVTFLVGRRGGGAGDEDDKVLKDIFEYSAGLVLVTTGGLAGTLFVTTAVSSALGATPALSILLFCLVALGLYLMLITTVRSQVLVVHAKPFFAIWLALVVVVATILFTMKFIRQNDTSTATG